MAEETIYEQRSFRSILAIILRFCLATYLAYHFYKRIGWIGIPLGIFLGLLPIFGGLALLYIAVYE